MITLITRPQTPDEIKRLRESIRPKWRFDIISELAFYGGLLILIPMVTAGGIGRILIFLGVPEDVAYLTPMFIAFCVGLYIAVREFLRERQSAKEDRIRSEAEIQSGTIEVVSVDGIESVWFFIHDNVPYSYLIRVDSGEYLYARVHMYLYDDDEDTLYVDDHWHEGWVTPEEAIKELGPGTFPGNSMVVERLPASKEIWNVTFSGDRVEMRPSIAALHDHYFLCKEECAILPRERPIPAGLIDQAEMPRAPKTPS